MERTKLRKLRELKGFSQSEIANLIHKEQSVYSRIENGISKLTDEDMLRLAEIYDCRLEDLVEDSQLIHIQKNNKYASHVQYINSEEAQSTLTTILKSHEELLLKITKEFTKTIEEIVKGLK